MSALLKVGPIHSFRPGVGHLTMAENLFPLPDTLRHYAKKILVSGNIPTTLEHPEAMEKNIMVPFPRKEGIDRPFRKLLYCTKDRNPSWRRVM